MASESKSISEILSVLSAAGSDKIDRIGFLPFLALMLLSLCAAYAVTLLYLAFFARRGSGSEAYRSFPLLGISVTAIFVCIQFSLPLSLGLLGALSIVRFRTPIKEPEEIGFIMLVIAVSLACATFQFLFVGIVLLVSVVGLLIAKLLYRRFQVKQTGTLILRMSEEQYQKSAQTLLESIQQRLSRPVLESFSNAGGVSTLTYVFSRPVDADVHNFLHGLASEFPGMTFNAYFDTPRPS